jgi:SNF2 family DNA or RNA helicase
MSGTPVTGAPPKFWSCLNWLYPKNFGSYWKFYERYTEYDIVYPQGYHKILGPANEQELQEIIDPFYVRHLKQEQCCPEHPDGVWDGPPKYYTQHWVELLPKQRKAYDDMKKDMVAWVGTQEQAPLVASVAVAQMMRLQQFAVAYANIGAEGNVLLDEPSSKLDAVMQIIEDNETEAIVIWSQFKQLIYLLEERCKKAKVDILLYTGDNRATRDQNVLSFAGGGAQVFAGTISAGGVGVDGLQGASSTMIFLDRLWSEPLNKQAEDRLWRDGQKNAVQIIDIMARNTVDLGRHQRLIQTWGWIKQLLGDPGAMQKEAFAGET